MAALHRTFEKYEQLNEEEFILEMLAGLNAATLPRTEQVSSVPFHVNPKLNKRTHI